MADLLKKGFFLGLGAGAMIKEAFDRTASEFSKRGESSAEGTSRAAREFMDELKRQFDAVSAKGAKEFERQAADVGLATKQDIERLELRIASLERKLAGLKAEGAHHAHEGFAGGGQAAGDTTPPVKG